MTDHTRRSLKKSTKPNDQYQPSNDTGSSSSLQQSHRDHHDFTYHPLEIGRPPSPRLLQLRRAFSFGETELSASSDQSRKESTDQSIRSPQQHKRLFEEAFPQEKLSSPQTTTREGTHLLFREQATPLSAHEEKFLQQPPTYPVTYYDQRTHQSSTIEYPIRHESGTPYTPYAFLESGPPAQLHFTDNPQDPRYTLEPTRYTLLSTKLGPFDVLALYAPEEARAYHQNKWRDQQTIAHEQAIHTGLGSLDLTNQLSATSPSDLQTPSVFLSDESVATRRQHILEQKQNQLVVSTDQKRDAFQTAHDHTHPSLSFTQWLEDDSLLNPLISQLEKEAASQSRLMEFPQHIEEDHRNDRLSDHDQHPRLLPLEQENYYDQLLPTSGDRNQCAIEAIVIAHGFLPQDALFHETVAAIEQELQREQIRDLGEMINFGDEDGTAMMAYLRSTTFLDDTRSILVSSRHPQTGQLRETRIGAGPGEPYRVFYQHETLHYWGLPQRPLENVFDPQDMAKEQSDQSTSTHDNGTSSANAVEANFFPEPSTTNLPKKTTRQKDTLTNPLHTDTPPSHSSPTIQEMTSSPEQTASHPKPNKKKGL